jgi:hypothetical protein
VATDTLAPTGTALPADAATLPTAAAQVGPPPGAELLADGVWKCPSDTTGAAYIGSSKSDRFHTLTCRSAQKIKDQNRICFAGREAAMAYGYVPCGLCKP